MQKLTKRAAVPRSAVVIPLDFKKSFLYHARCATIARMSGYPSALHSIGRIQESIKLDSYANLLTSLHKLHQLVYVTAEVILTMEGTKVDRYQINRTEIMAYVDQITSTTRSTKLNDDDIDLISHLIVSFEANPAAWILQGGEGENSLHVQFQRLYKEVLMESDSDLAIYASHTDKITTIADLPQFKTIVSKDKKKARLDTTEDTVDTETKTTKSAFTTIHQFAAARVIDHVYQLLTDKDIWYHFIIPRTRADVATNIERAKSLKVFALYIQSLLTYHQFFSIEMFMKSYDLVQEWITHFPPLDATTTNNLEKTIRSHDLLDARGDADSLIASFSESAKQDLSSLVFPREFLGTYGFVNAVDSVSEQAGEYSLTGDISNFQALDNPKYLPLTSGVSVSTFDVTYKLSIMLLKSKVISKEIEDAMIGLVPSLTRGAAKAAIESLKALNIRCSLPFKIPHAATYNVESGVVKEVSGGKLILDSGSPDFSFDFHHYIRHDLKFKLTTDHILSKTYGKFYAAQIPDADRARELRDILSYQWKSLVPSYWAAADRTVTEDRLFQDKDEIKFMMEKISGISYEIAIRELSLAHIQKIWATYLSSFALLYVTEDDTVTLESYLKQPSMNADKLKLVTGYGKPYGATYSTLEVNQGILDDKTRLIPLGRGKFIRMLKSIPVVTDDLQVDPTPFYSERPVMYFSSNSVKQDVKEWVWADGLLNFTLMPTPAKSFVPEVKFTPKYAFYNMNLYFNMDINYRPGSPSQAREVVDIDVVTSEWPYDRYQYFLKYNHFGPYAKPASAIPITDEMEMIADAVKKIEHNIDADAKVAADSSKTAGTAITDIATNAKNEIDKQKKNTEPGASDEGDATVL